MKYCCSKNIPDKTYQNDMLNYQDLKELLENVSEHDHIYLLDDSYYGKFYIKTPNLTIIGLDTFSKLTYDVSHGDLVRESDGGDGIKVYGTTGSASVTITPEAHGLICRNIIFENSYKRVKKGSTQAVALKTEAKGGEYVNCRFISTQDTLYIEDNENLFHECYIEGDVDFIFGSGDAVFSECEILLVEVMNSNAYLCAPSTYLKNKYGLCFIDCNIKSQNTNKTYLGRAYYPTGALDTVKPRTIFINCNFPSNFNEYLITMHEGDPVNYQFYLKNCKKEDDIISNYDDENLTIYYRDYAAFLIKRYEDKIIERFSDAVFKFVKTLRSQAEAIVEYNSTVGEYEIQRMKLGIELIKTKRRLDLLEEYRQNNTEIDEFAIEELVNDEVLQFENEFKEMKEFIKQSKDLVENGEEISLEEINSLNDLLYSLIYKYHPHLHLDKSADYKDIFEQITNAYVNYDLDTLKDYYNLSKDDDINTNIKQIKEETTAFLKAVKDKYENSPLQFLTEEGNYDFTSSVEFLKKEIDDIDIQIKFFNEKIIEFFPKNQFDS